MLRNQLVLLAVVVIAGCSKSTEQAKAPALSEAENLYRRGSELLKTDPTQAIVLLTKSLDLNPDAPPAIYNRAVAYARLGRDAEALADIARLERIAPEVGRQLRGKMKLSAGPYTDLAEQEYTAKNFAAAIRKCDSALAYDPEWGDAWVVKALALQKLGQPEKALECYNKGAEAEPTNYFVYINRAELHHQQKRLEQALADYAKYIKLRPNEPAAYLGRSAVYTDLQMPDKAAADTAKAAELKAKRETKGGS
jgi:tetratricopeptide (TPR) repeat protein